MKITFPARADRQDLTIRKQTDFMTAGNTNIVTIAGTLAGSNILQNNTPFPDRLQSGRAAKRPNREPQRGSRRDNLQGGSDSRPVQSGAS